MVLKSILGIWIAAVIAAALFFVPPAEGFTQSRIIFLHVPCAMVAVVGFVVSMIYAVLYLKRRDPLADAKSAISAELGLIFAVLATISGSIFARIEWGSWWNWDPRETSIVILLVIYAAYFALRSAVDIPERRATLSAVYAILAMPAMVFLTFVAPRIMASLHPSDTLAKSSGLSPEYRIVLYAAMLGMLGLYSVIFSAKLKKVSSKK